MTYRRVKNLKAILARYMEFHWESRVVEAGTCLTPTGATTMIWREKDWLVVAQASSVAYGVDKVEQDGLVGLGLPHLPRRFPGSAGSLIDGISLLALYKVRLWFRRRRTSASGDVETK